MKRIVKNRESEKSNFEDSLRKNKDQENQMVENSNSRDSANQEPEKSYLWNPFQKLTISESIHILEKACQCYIEQNKTKTGMPMAEY